MGMTIDDFETKALQVLLSQRFIDFPLFEEEELSNYEVADIQGSMPFDDFIRQYAEIIMEQVKATYEQRLKADMAAMLEGLNLEIDEMFARRIDYTVDKIQDLIQQKIDLLKEAKDGENNN